MIILEAVNLKKTYRRELPLYKQVFLPFSRRQQVKALDSVSICIEAGQILGVVGPNGAGKTTLMRILADLLEADTGSVRICGQTPTKNNFRIRSRIGYVSSDERSFFWRLTGRENLEFFACLYGLSFGQAKERTVQLIKDFGFENKADQLFRDYSAGMRKKVSVMRALLHEPSLLLLDEVTNSLDPGSAKLVRQMVRQYVSTRKGCAAVWSTHRLEEISQLCDTVIMIDSGRIVGGGLAEDFSDNGNMPLDYLLKTKNLNGQFEAFYQKIACKATAQTNLKDNSSEFIFNGITQEQFGKIVSLVVKDYGAHILFAGCIKKDQEMLFDKFSGEKICDGCS